MDVTVICEFCLIPEGEAAAETDWVTDAAPDLLAAPDTLVDTEGAPDADCDTEMEPDKEFEPELETDWEPEGEFEGLEQYLKTLLFW